MKLAEKSRECFRGEFCPCCGQRLAGEALKKAEASFLSRKNQEISEIQREISEKETEKAEGEEGLRKLEKAIDGVLKTQAERQQEAETIRKDYVQRTEALQEKIRQLQRLLTQNPSQKLQREKEAEIAQDLRAISRELSKKDLIREAEKRLLSLQEDEKKKTQALTYLDGQLQLLEDFQRYKVLTLEEDLNSHFHLARFRLFRRQVDGSLEPRCDVTYEGVPYSDLNTGMRINLGIDIIRSLSLYYGVTVPLFVDNSESITRMEKPLGQVIRLAVSDRDPVLRLE